MKHSQGGITHFLLLLLYPQHQCGNICELLANKIKCQHPLSAKHWAQNVIAQMLIHSFIIKTYVPSFRKGKKKRMHSYLHTRCKYWKMLFHKLILCGKNAFVQCLFSDNMKMTHIKRQPALMDRLLDKQQHWPPEPLFASWNVDNHLFCKFTHFIRFKNSNINTGLNTTIRWFLVAISLAK